MGGRRKSLKVSLVQAQCKGCLGFTIIKIVGPQGCVYISDHISVPLVTCKVGGCVGYNCGIEVYIFILCDVF